MCEPEKQLNTWLFSIDSYHLPIPSGLRIGPLLPASIDWKSKRLRAIFQRHSPEAFLLYADCRTPHRWQGVFR